MKYKESKETVLYGNFKKEIRIPEIKIRYNRGKVIGSITSSENANQFLKRVYGRSISIQEQFVMLLLNNSLKVIGYYKHTIGTPTSAVLDIPMLMGIALKTLSRAIIVSHNHPSGNTAPSQGDINVTRKILEATKTLDIRFVDHVILTPEGKQYSFAEESQINLGGFEKSDDNIERALRLEILSQLRKVTTVNAPKIYEIISTKEGYQRIEKRIIQMVISDKLTPSACIPQIESELL